jgi:hypothetical protein
MNPSKTNSAKIVSCWRHIFNQQNASASLITRQVNAVRLKHGNQLTRRGLSELTYSLRLAEAADARHSEVTRILAGELAEARHEERLKAKKPSEDNEISYARRLVLLKIADRVLCGP